ncbi:E3 SUMO-protein ligase ZNF451 isoform X1 [Latimeria chalumnae]|uniref:E3 SUMO-protein ligase ZNF451 isoform X1 n=1 Tax=Latimeria chalumnae TaxID=7897 RepID=UPI0003C181C3|nr:PREDICTED: zinc finger protein 451 isoform X2 [Latimeria chalumnae]|eukprot:XP_014351684.1 PREDICTED: zinc finger protein 451 isoform X2 [Latimeria chalumnae]
MDAVQINESLENGEDSSCDDDDVKFVSEGPLRPVLCCIDLLSSDDDANEERSSQQVMRRIKPKDHVDREKARVASTLDRLARHVEVEKQQKVEKNKAFQEKVDSQHAHGLQELQFFQGQTSTEEAKRCVDQWLKMAGPKPGSTCSGQRGSLRETVKWPTKPDPILCPIMHCNRKFDNGQLLLGHLKRFDHSPCDPTITLHGPSNTAYACVVCCRRFVNQQQYSDHLLSKVDLADGHRNNLPPQNIQCYACPSCFLLFNLRDECLQHMSGMNHFGYACKLSDDQGIAVPLPFPAYAKKLLISLCKDVPFQVKCTACHRVLRSHVELTAHFRAQCRNSGPMAVSKKRISQVAEIFIVRAYCDECNKMFPNVNEIQKHTQQNEHSIRMITRMEEAILAFCHLSENSTAPFDLRLLLENTKSKASPLKRTLMGKDLGSKELAVSSLKRKRDSTKTGQAVDTQVMQDTWKATACTITKVWICECSRRFPTEKAVEKHVMAANSIFYKCVVCGKVAEDSGVINLHMSRFHGGAHLTNYIFWCRGCKTEMPRKEDILSHVVESHDGHSYYCEQEVSEDEPSTSSSKESGHTSDKWRVHKGISSYQSSLTPANSAAGGKWQCRICEKMFDSRDHVKQHCDSLGSHQFHRYCCGHCKYRFHKIETLYRHCQDLHNCEIKIKYICGLCSDLVFDGEQEFLSHYRSLHSTEYVFLADQSESSVKSEMPACSEESCFLTCGCQESYTSKTLKREAHKRCRKKLFERGQLWYRCNFCQATAQSEKGMEVHLLETHSVTQVTRESCGIRCGVCSKTFIELEGASQHYHQKHCFSQKPQLGALFGSETRADVFRFMPSGTCAEKTRLGQHTECPANTESSDVVQAKEEEESELPDLDYLRTMTHIVFVDLDNWPSFFKTLPGHLNQGTFIWGFQGWFSSAPPKEGGKANWKPPENCPVFNHLCNTGSFFLHPPCSNRKDAADFAICLHAGRLDEQLPKHIPFTILSGDKGFLELEHQFKKTMRPAHILNPHHLEGEMMCALLNSITDTGKDSDEEDDENLKLTLELSLQAETNKKEIKDVELEEAIKRSLEEM